MFEKPHMTTTDGVIRVQIQSKSADALIEALDLEGFKGKVVDPEFIYTDLNSGVEENVSIVELGNVAKLDVLTCLRRWSKGR